MRLRDLERCIADFRSVYGDNVNPVIDVAVQPDHPMRAGVKGVVTQNDIDQGSEREWEEEKPSFWIVISDPESYVVPLGREMWSV